MAFTVNELPKLPNQSLYRHWRSVQREKDRWRMLVGCQVFDRKPERPLERAALKLERHSSVECDPDAIAASFKYVIDALVGNGVLVGDSSSHVKLDPPPAWHKAPPKRGFITVEVTEL